MASSRPTDFILDTNYDEVGWEHPCFCGHSKRLHTTSPGHSCYGQDMAGCWCNYYAADLTVIPIEDIVSGLREMAADTSP